MGIWCKNGFESQIFLHLPVILMLRIIANLNFKIWFLECCGSFTDAVNKIKPLLNAKGRKEAGGLRNVISLVQVFIENGEMKIIGSHFKTIGIPAMRQLEGKTENNCLKNIFRNVAERGNTIADQFKQKMSVKEGKQLVCKFLNAETKRLNRCSRK